jgi:hypothetical protein
MAAKNKKTKKATRKKKYMLWCGANVPAIHGFGKPYEIVKIKKNCITFINGEGVEDTAFPHLFMGDIDGKPFLK